MSSLYDKADIYDLGFDERKWQIVKEHWERLLGGAGIDTVLDCSIGTGNLTLQLAELGKKVTGSDLNPVMLDKCAQKAQDKKLSVELFTSDFRRISENTHKKYDCVMSTGNSLPYVPNDEVLQALHQMDLLVREGGYIYVDTRNWDKIIREHQRFYFYPPYYDKDVRIDSFQVWDYNGDGSITFNIVYSFEKETKIIRREIFEETYYPIKREVLSGTLEGMGYEIKKMANFPLQCSLPIDDFEWYCILAQKRM
ncbi:class I SAM-dependent DNA methyltransferase [Eisenbergiella sp.]